MHHVVIVGGGIAGLAAAHALRRYAEDSGRELRLSVVDAAARFGGKVATSRREGFVVEAGPDAFVPYKPWALALVRELGLEDALVPSRDERAGIDLVRGGRPEPLPAGLPMLVPTDWPALLRSPLLSWPAKLRWAAERDIAQRRSADDESVADFVRRRCGAEVLRRIAEPLLASLHVGDVERMSVASAIPRLAALEREHGSLATGAARQARRVEGASGPLFWSLRGGMATLIEALVERLPPEARYHGRRPLAIRPAGGGWDVLLDGDRRLEADTVILAVPAAAAAALLAPLDADLGEALRRLRTASVAVASVAFPAEAVRPPRGFGFFVPRAEGRGILAGTWTSSKFDHRAPEGALLARVFLGGVHDEGAVERPRDELRALVLGELAALFGLRAEPSFVHVDRWPSGYPQYDVGHGERIARIVARLPPGVALAGSAYFGVGLPDCIRGGREAASSSWARLGARESRRSSRSVRPCVG